MTMTIQQLAELVERDRSTVLRWVQGVADRDMELRDRLETALQTKKPVEFDLEELCLIMQEGRIQAGFISLLRENAKNAEKVAALSLEATTLKKKLALAPPSVDDMVTVRDFLTANGIKIPAQGAQMYLQALANRCDKVAPQMGLPSFRDSSPGLEPDQHRYTPEVIGEAVRQLVPRFGTTGNAAFDGEQEES